MMNKNILNYQKMSLTLNKLFKAFTLAEVLITLGIIGVVATLVIPVLISNIQQQIYITGFKKSYSSLQNATKMVMGKKGITSIVNFWTDSYGMAQDYADVMKITKICSSSHDVCFHNYLAGDIIKTLDGTDLSAAAVSVNYGAYIALMDGELIQFYLFAPDCTGSIGDAKSGDPLSDKACATMQIDTNGFKGPNRRGLDIMFFSLTQDGSIYAGGTGGAFGASKYCDPQNYDVLNGLGCPAIYLMN